MSLTAADIIAAPCRQFPHHYHFLEPVRCFLNQHIDHIAQSCGIVFAGSPGLLPNGYLFVGTGASLQDCAAVFNLRYAVEKFSVLANEFDDFVEQVRIWHDLAFAEVDQALVEAVALCTPPVLRNHDLVVDAPALVVSPESPQHPQ